VPGGASYCGQHRTLTDLPNEAQTQKTARQAIEVEVRDSAGEGIYFDDDDIK
jgi:hypothetical protein